jgi:hypothetical protein
VVISLGQDLIAREVYLKESAPLRRERPDVSLGRAISASGHRRRSSRRSTSAFAVHMRKRVE